MSYQKNLLTAREAANLRRQQKGLGQRKRRFVDNEIDEALLSGEGIAKRSLISSRKKEPESEFNFMTEFFNKLYASNVDLKSQIQEALKKANTETSLKPKTYEQVVSRLKDPEMPDKFKSDPAFLANLEKLKKDFPGVTEHEVFKIIEGESKGDPTEVSEAGAVGMFQMMEEPLAELGYTPDEVLNMEPAEQLSVYGLYLKRWGYDGSYGLGIIQAAPAFRNASPDTVVYKKDSKEWKMNPGWRPRDGGDITKRSIENYYGRIE
tara:strand:- start:1719 stop:2510 length:792 start_codon:yes stop_codon:yes gene_type:complete